MSVAYVYNTDIVFEFIRIFCYLSLDVLCLICKLSINKFCIFAISSSSKILHYDRPLYAGFSSMLKKIPERGPINTKKDWLQFYAILHATFREKKIDEWIRIVFGLTACMHINEVDWLIELGVCSFVLCVCQNIYIQLQCICGYWGSSNSDWWHNWFITLLMFLTIEYLFCV